MSEKSPKRSYVIAVANQKGGVAKTTTVASLGGALAQREFQVLLVDLDAQANLTLAFGINPSQLHGSITDVLFNGLPLHRVSKESSVPGLDIVPASSDVSMAERFLPVRQDYELILKRSMNGAVENRGSSTTLSLYDFILFDCPPSLGAITINALATSDLLIVPTQPEYFSTQALRSMIDSVRQLHKNLNPKLIFRILITLMDRRNRIHRDFADHIRNSFKENVFNNNIEVDTKIRESALAGKPITHFRDHSRSSIQYNALAEELWPYAK